MTEIVLEDFMGIFPNAASEEYCNKIINRFDQQLQKNRQHQNEGEEKLSVVWGDGFFETDGRDAIMMQEKDMPLLQEFEAMIWKNYDIYARKWGILPNVSQHQMNYRCRVQKTSQPSMPNKAHSHHDFLRNTYCCKFNHSWHCDSSNMSNCHRIISCILYLNTVEEGGETEFLYQQKKISPAQGTLFLFPAGWTHTHRGNFPLKGDKYFITTYLEYTEK